MGDEAARTPGGLAGRVSMGAALALLAIVLVVAARSDPAPRPDRVGRRMELMELIAEEQSRNRLMADRVEELSAQVADYEEAVTQGEEELAVLQRRVDEVAAPAGLTGVVGSGVTVTLADSSLPYTPEYDPNDLVVHEQDLQAVINALWSGGAEALAVNGQRVLSTTAIRCVGNTLLLHGGLYPPPYIIEAVGDAAALRDALDRDPGVQLLEAAVDTYQLGYGVEDARRLQLPAYEGFTTLAVADPAGAAE